MTQAQRLAEPFPAQLLETMQKGNRSLTYVAVSEVIYRMNDVLGTSGWSRHILTCHRDAIEDDWILAHVRVKACVDGDWTEKDGFGGQKVNRTKNGEIVDLGDDFKGAVSDAFKKACQDLGVGLHLARTTEALAATKKSSEWADDSKTAKPYAAAPPIGTSIKDNPLPEAEVSVNEIQRNRIIKLASERRVDLAAMLSMAGFESLATVPQERGQKLIDWLERQPVKDAK